MTHNHNHVLHFCQACHYDILLLQFLHKQTNIDRIIYMLVRGDHDIEGEERHEHWSEGGHIINPSHSLQSVGSDTD